MNNMNSNNQHGDLPADLALLLDQATGDAAHTNDDGWREPDEVELAAAEAAVAYARSQGEPLPESLRSTLRATAGQAEWKRASASSAPSVAGRIVQNDQRSTRQSEMKSPPLPSNDRTGTTGSSSVMSAAGWLVAAAAIAIAAVGWMRPDASTPAPGTGTVAQRSVEERLAALEQDPQSVTSDWFAWPGGTLAPEIDPRPVASEVTGKFVWNEQKQEGYMVFENMPVNDPTLEQYQLWLVSGDHQHPIDGGVFNIASSGRVIVPIDPKIKASNLAALGVTVEKPGGVVVSSREDRMVAALVPQG